MKVLTTLDIVECRLKQPEKLDVLSMDETFFMPQLMKLKYKDRIIKQKDRAGDLVSPWTEKTEQSIQPRLVPASTTVCPWTYNIVYNPQRIPHTILEANCSSEQCLAPHLSNHTRHTEPSFEDEEQHQSPYSNTPPPKTMCQEVKYYRWVKVKSQRKIQGKAKLSKKLLPVTVACSCISINNIPS